MLPPPELPPLLTGHPVTDGYDPSRVALEGGRAGHFGAGILCWSDETAVAAAALVLEPEVPLRVAAQMAPLMLVAIGDALGAIGPPNFSYGVRWPLTVLANGGVAGEVTLARPEGARAEEVPAHIVVGFRIALTLPDDLPGEPGEVAHLTALHEEGCGDIDRSALIGAVARHFLSWLDAWHHEGFTPVARVLTSRLEPEASVEGARLVRIDDTGSAIAVEGQGERGIPLTKALGIRT
ncbi:biotin/lipoate--protein ligase family protein [Ostreiculturibacter nitratireducens]|uniref:biotin/lipoate--protein ligase family protein n=1 Tax=Ostreiculturibacter nitratireducens TaxID=3075226 RepID=UPI0031B57031